MTIYVLHGGFTSANNKLNNDYYKEVSKYVADGANILLVYFAREDNEVDKLFEQDKSLILEQAGDKQLSFTLATQDKLEEQLKNTDVIYLRGGETKKLLKGLNKVDFASLVKDKVVVGSSAGAYVIATYYTSASDVGKHKGLGLLPVRVICHYQSSEFSPPDDPIVQMNQCPQELELLILKDFEWKTYTI